jgi:hypothetical protein
MEALALSHRLQALPALAMRQAVLRETLAALSVEEAATLCGELVRRGKDGAPYDLALVALNAVLDANELGYDRHQEIYAEARRRGDEPLARLLLSAQPVPDGVPERAPIPGRPDITLGERKSLARGDPRKVPRDLFDRILRDTDPSVLEIVLGNPRVTEGDVVRLAARRPTTVEAQRVIFRCERFIARYPVKRALAFNPYTPSDVAARLVPLLTRPDLKLLMEDSKVADPVRQAARASWEALPPRAR